jgi:hypothetical protein
MAIRSGFSKPSRSGNTLVIAISLLTDEELRMMTSADLLDLIRMSEMIQAPLMTSMSSTDCEWDAIHDSAIMVRDLCRLEWLLAAAEDGRPMFSLN